MSSLKIWWTSLRVSWPSLGSSIYFKNLLQGFRSYLYGSSRNAKFVFKGREGGCGVEVVVRHICEATLSWNSMMESAGNGNPMIEPNVGRPQGMGTGP